MGKDQTSSSHAKPKAPPHRRQAAELTRGKSHAQLISQRKSLKKDLLSRPADQKAKAWAHFRGSERDDVARTRLRQLRQDDARRDTSGLSAYQVRSLHKRQAKPNMALRRSLDRRGTKRLEHALAAVDAGEILRSHAAGIVETENDMEKTVQLTQHSLKHEHLAEHAAVQIYDLDLPERGPYRLRYDRSGRFALLAGTGGHVSIVDQQSLALKTEFFVESVRDACFLHNGSLMAVSQEQNVFIYDDAGVEVHRLAGHRRVGGMEFLPYHWLLGENGRLLG